ncbi:hypothetical protein FYM97_03615 [Lactobacillus salivarius]|nr:hypothetical protein [Ligilactobacillus salivarius]MYU58743.1 hypothetical protein [Ligilactobacillus salivarius]MYU89864.1 hypothetical protein [Ligilactobacillus salivarius]MYV15197.1 hypothetical protein [Ligilactobacillus salivarius]MYY50912.1 hypothetical protein [Ligilactobacillus salivarius]
MVEIRINEYYNIHVRLIRALRKLKKGESYEECTKKEETN